jgi:hypothetical protein
MWLPITPATTLLFGRDEIVDAAACRAASLGANTVTPLACSSAAANVIEELPPSVRLLVLLDEELVEDKTGSPDRIVLSIVSFCLIRAVEIGPGGSRTPSIT